MGQGLALALTQRGRKSLVLGRDWLQHRAQVQNAGLVLVAVPDDAIAAVAQTLATSGAITAPQIVLHLSGLLDRSALDPLASTDAGRGSFHPLQSIVDPSTAAERLRGAYAGIEGDDRALQAAEALAQDLGMIAVRLSRETKAAYHAAAAIVSNYTTALLAMSQRIATEAGLPEEYAKKMYFPLLRGTIANIEAQGPINALTGPIVRGDIQTVRAHLEVLQPADRELYRQLALAALRMATPKLDQTKSDQLEKLLTNDLETSGRSGK